MSEEALDSDVRLRIERSVGRRVRGARRVERGYTPALRWVVEFDDGSRAFAKAGVDSPTSSPATWLRREREAYASIRGPFMPEMLAWDDDGVTPLLVLEDLSDWAWPPPWAPEHVSAVLNFLATMGSTPAPSDAPSLELRERERLSGWRRIADDPHAFLAIGLVTEGWLDRSLGVLIDASDAAVLEGDSLVHFDLRSDNLCVRDGRAKVIDWSVWARGNPLVDLAAWLPSLWREGGPPPWEILVDSGGLAPLLTGYFAAQAGAPDDSDGAPGP